MENLKVIKTLNEKILLHKSSVKILENIKATQLNVFRLEREQKQFKQTFGQTSGQIGFNILSEHRRLKVLARSYNKTMVEIKL